MNGWTVETGVMHMNNITPSSKKKTSISVREMRQILGLNKVESYWLVHQNRFRTIVAAGRMRIMLDSFEEWYAGQFHYKKVNGEAPGSKWEKTTMSIREAAALLGLQEATLYDLLKKKPFQTIQVDNRTRIDRTSFWAWYESQDFYRTVADQQADRLKFGETLTMPEVARLLGTHRNNVYYLVQKGCFETIQTSRTKLICKDSFERWYKGQSKYRIVSAANGGDEDGIHC